MIHIQCVYPLGRHLSWMIFACHLWMTAQLACSTVPPGRLEYWIRLRLTLGLPSCMARKTEIILALRGKAKKAAMATLAAHTEGEGLARVSLLPISPTKSLRVVRSDKHVGAMAQASTKSSV